jgi:hypothetical protein
MSVETLSEIIDSPTTGKSVSLKTLSQADHTTIDMVATRNNISRKQRKHVSRNSVTTRNKSHNQKECITGDTYLARFVTH